MGRKSRRRTQLATRAGHNADGSAANALRRSPTCENLHNRPPGPGPRVNLFWVAGMLSWTPSRAYGSIASRFPFPESHSHSLPLRGIERGARGHLRCFICVLCVFLLPSLMEHRSPKVPKSMDMTAKSVRKQLQNCEESELYHREQCATPLPHIATGRRKVLLSGGSSERLPLISRRNSA